MKRWSSVVFLLMFLWLQTFQVCDAGGDVVENLPAAMQWQSGHKLSLSAPIPADDGDDAAIPSVFDQTLTQGGESTVSPLTALEGTTALQPVVLVSRAVVPDSRNLSPPNNRHPNFIGHSNDVFIPSNGTLAPPSSKPFWLS